MRSSRSRIREMFASRGRPMPENNLRQALVPQGASTIPQQPGTAPGLVCPVGDKVIYAVPGVPYEMREMFSGTVIGDLQERAGVRAVIASRVLRTWGQSESGLAEMLAERIDHLDAIGNPTLAFLASGIEGIKVRVTAKAETEAEVEALLAAEEVALRDILGHLVFALDDDNMEAAVIALLAERDLTLGVVETTTGGLLASRLSAAGGEGTFVGGVVASSDGLTGELVGRQRDELIDLDGARALARAARSATGADVGIATTAVDDRSQGTDARPFGSVFVAVSSDELDVTEEVRLPGDRERIRQYSCITVLNLLRLHLEGHR